MKDCLQFLIEPAKKLKIRLKVRMYITVFAAVSKLVHLSLQNVPAVMVFFSFLSSVCVLQESRKRVRLEKKEPLVESQLFIMELARELNKICQVSSPSLSFLAFTQNHRHSFVSFVTPEVKHPGPHLDQRGHLASQCLSRFHRGMGRCFGEESTGTK